MRVALLSHNAQAGDAIGNQVADKLALFVDRGAEVRVFVESRARLHPQVAAHCQVLRPEPAGDGWDFLSAADLVCVEFGQYYSLLDLVPLLAGSKTRVLIDYHGVTPPELWGTSNPEALDKGLHYRGLVWCAERIIVHSGFTERELIEATGIPMERLCRLGFPIDRERFSPLAGRGKALGVPGLEGASVLLFVGRLAPSKGLPVLIEALARLRDVRPVVHALLAGDAGGLYQGEADRCRQLARELGIADRVHILGHLGEESLREAYRSADLFVTPSRSEGFCIPVMEAMASGLPVIAAWAGALPETVGNAGLSFRVDDAEDLARQIQRVLGRPAEAASLCPPPSPRRKRIALVSFRYGTDFAGGAEWSLRRIANALHDSGRDVEVLTTCTRDENHWRNDLPAGPCSIDGITVQRFRLDPHDRSQHLAAVRAILEASGRVPPEVELAYVRHSLHSTELLDALRERIDDLDALIVGPYLSGLTWDVARTFPDKTLVVPCFHDEPMAHLAVWRETYERIAGILYHSIEEQELAQAVLGVNHPAAVVIGTWLASEGGRLAGKAAAMPSGRYLVYCGRYSEQKNLPLVIDFARRYCEQHAGRFTFVFLGQGEVKIPTASWARNLGFVSETEKRQVLAGADALVQLSQNESLSLVALEAWSAGAPVIASRNCAVLAGHLERSAAGAVVDDYAGFARVLDAMWEDPEGWRARGRRGQDYVRVHYGSVEEFQGRLHEALTAMATPLREQMRRRGLERCAAFDGARWRDKFSSLVETVLEAAPCPYRREVELQQYQEQISASATAKEVLVSVRVRNCGTLPLLAEGPGRTVLRCQVVDESNESVGPPASTRLPGFIPPGQTQPAVVMVPVPTTPGLYHAVLSVEPQTALATSITFALSVGMRDSFNSPSRCAPVAPLLAIAQTALADASRLQRLPDHYVDVTEGWFARAKLWLKRKLLNNFKHAYVDVLSRQQSRVNQQLITSVQQLADCCVALDHAVGVLQDRLKEVECVVRNAKKTRAADEAEGIVLERH